MHRIRSSCGPRHSAGIFHREVKSLRLAERPVRRRHGEELRLECRLVRGGVGRWPFGTDRDRMRRRAAIGPRYKSVIDAIHCLGQWRGDNALLAHHGNRVRVTTRGDRIKREDDSRRVTRQCKVGEHWMNIAEHGRRRSLGIGRGERDAIKLIGIQSRPSCR